MLYVFGGPAAGTRARPAQIIGQAAPESANTPSSAGGGSSTGGTFVPLTPSNIDYSASNAQQAAAAQQSAGKTVQEQEPVYSFYPILNENRWLWQFLHSVLMLLSFCFLLPLGSLLARHKWIFGRDPLSVRHALQLTCQQTYWAVAVAAAAAAAAMGRKRQSQPCSCP
jgi:hypothetical protein